MPALDGMKILGMTQWEAGTSCTQALAWLGADVVKIERPGTGDPGRSLGLGFEASEYFVTWNSNNRSVAVDLEKEEGRELVRKMVPHFDVFVENYALGVVEKLGLGYEELRELNPGLIYASVKGFGHTGPHAHYKSFDVVTQAAAGAFSITGEPDGPPMRPGPTMGDSGSGMQLALGITAAYVQKLRTGKGQHVTVSMQEAMTYYMRTMIAMGSQWGTQVAPRVGNGIGPLINMYACKPFGANDYVYIMAMTERMWEAICEVIERPDMLGDPRFADAEKRTENKDVLVEEIAKWTRTQTKRDAMKKFGDAGVAASAVYDTVDLYTDPHLNERGFVQTVQHKAIGDVKLLGWPVGMSESEVPIKAAPLLGQHTAEVLSEYLNLSERDIQGLGDRGVIALEEPEE